MSKIDDLDIFNANILCFERLCILNLNVIIYQ